MTRVRKYAKFVVALVGGTVSLGLTVFPPDTRPWQIATGLSLILTALGVRQIPNTKQKETP